MKGAQNIKKLSKLFKFAFFFCLFLNVQSLHSAEQRSVAVLGFKNLSGDTSLDYIGSGFGETLTTKLTKVKELKLIERMQILEIFKEQKLQIDGYVEQESAVQAGKILKVQYTIIGSYQKLGEKLKADIRLVNVETGGIDAADDVVGDYENLFDLQYELALKLIKSLNVFATKEEKVEIAKKPTETLSAYEYFARGAGYYEKLEYDKAIESFTKAIEIDESYQNAYVYRGCAYYLKKLYVEAVKDYTKAIKLDPKGANAYINRGTAYVYKGLYGQAIDDYTKAIELNPTNELAYLARGNAYRAKFLFEMAHSDYSKAIELNSKNAIAYIYRADISSFDEAVKDYTRAIELDPKNADAYYGRSVAYYNKYYHGGLYDGGEDFKNKADDDGRKATELGKK